MTSGKVLDLQQIRRAIAELDELSKKEYGLGLEQVLVDDTPNGAVRLQRLTGIVLKREFAEPGGPPTYTRTGARRSWPWKDAPPEASAERAPREFEILRELRMPGPWNERKPLSGTVDDQVPISWEQLQDDADNERGLFKILALYVEDKLKGRDRKTLREYLETDESRRFEAGLDLATLVFDAAITGPVAALLGLPTLAVGVALVGVQYGYRALTDVNTDRIGDRSS